MNDIEPSIVSELASDFCILIIIFARYFYDTGRPASRIESSISTLIFVKAALDMFFLYSTYKSGFKSGLRR